MEYVRLGTWGPLVSRLCLGSLTMGPLQRNLSLEEARPVLERAFQGGINFVDTAEYYQNYPLLREMLRMKPDLVVCTKSYAYDTATAEASFRAATKALGRDYIDIFLLHEQESIHTLRGHWEALEYYRARQREGLIGAVGLSTHHVAAVEAAIRHPEIQIIHAIFNVLGLGIQDGTRAEMESALERAAAQGAGIYAMKALAGGHLIGREEEAFDYVCSKPYVHAVAVGMQRVEEVEWNLRRFENRPIPPELTQSLARVPRQLFIHDYCRGCGSCVARCPAGALRLEAGPDGTKRAVVEAEACMLCGYCVRSCPEFAIKVI